MTLGTIDKSDNTRKLKDKNTTKKQTVYETPSLKKKCVINGSSNLWVCVNAMNDCHTCIFCKCPSCYLTEQKLESRKRNTRGRRHQMKSIDDQNLHTGRRNKLSKCHQTNHADNHLIPYSDSTYFSSSYQKRIALNKNKFIPTECSECGAVLVDK